MKLIIDPQIIIYTHYITVVQYVYFNYPGDGNLEDIYVSIKRMVFI